MTEPEEERTVQQLRYLHGRVYPDILLGMKALYLKRGRPCPAENVEMVENAMKALFLPRPDEDIFGLRMISPTPRTKAALSAYIDEVVLWAAEHMIYVRQPGETEIPE